MEKFAVRCSGCGKKLLFEEKHRGRSVPCPVCRTSVRLESSGTTPAKPDPSVIEDPFSELAATPVAPSLKPLRRGSGDVASNDLSQRKKEASLDHVENRKSESFDVPSDDQEQEPDDSVSNNEPFIDEFGLGELSELQSEEWSATSALPPVQKRLIKKPKRSADIASNSEEEAAKTSKTTKNTRGFEEPENLSRRRWLSYAVLFLTLLPLAIVVLLPDTDDVASRVAESAEAAEEAGNWNEANAEADPNAIDEAQVEEVMDEDPLAEDVENGLDDFIRALPGQRIHGALLARDSWGHWVFAGISGIAFTTLFLALFRRHKDAVGGAIVGALFTATAGIVLLLGLQTAAIASAGIGVVRFGRRAGLIALLFLVVRAIGFSYRCALEPGAGFMGSFMGFTLGVGICEEVCKILPVIVYLGTSKNASWQGSCLVGLASGVGFGVSEGIMYSSNYYNGISGAEIYLVRFVSCVALHAVWTGAGAVLLYFNQESLHSEWTDIITIIAMTLGISIILHGLYDTLLKQEMPVWALLIGFLSVGWLIGVVEKQTLEDAA